jgi:phosphatidylinositol glycan class U
MRLHSAAHLERCTELRHPLLSASILFYSACLLPAFHHLWLYAGSGNANFFYASTLVWSIGTGALVLDLLFAFLKLDFLRAQGVEGDTTAVVVQE